MIKYLKLLRLPNLIIIGLTQYLMRYCIIEPILGFDGFKLQMSNFNFAFLVLSTIFIAAAGYVINDYFDRRIDLINRPGEVLVGGKIDRRYAMAIHIALNVIGVAMGVYLAFIIKVYLLAFIYLAISGLFWYYSTNYKKQFLIGNIIVALLTALVPLQVVLYETVFLTKTYEAEAQNISTVLFWWIAAFSFFAFMTNLTREIIKDIEDFEGDNAFGRSSLPVVLGIKTSKIIAVTLLIITSATIFYSYYSYLGDLYTLIYILIAIFLPILILIIILLKGHKKKDFKLASLILKIVMLTGILYAILVKYIIQNII